MMKKLTLVTALLCILAMPAAAVDFKAGDWDLSLGGSIRLDAGYQISDLGDEPLGYEDSKTDFFTENPGNSRVNFGAAYGDVSGFIEAGIGNGSTIYTRHAYINYNMGDNGSLLIGQTWSLLAPMNPCQRLNGDNILKGYGNLYSHRAPQIRYTNNYGDMITYSVAIEDTKYEEPSGLAPSYVVNDIIPALQANASIKVNENVSVTPSALVQQSEMKSQDFVIVGGQTIPGKDQTLITWAGAVDATVKIDTLTLSGEFWYGQNVGLISDYIDSRPDKASSTFGMPIADLGLVGFKDVIAYGGWAQVSMPIEAITFNAGVGYQTSEVNGIDMITEDDVTTQAVYANFVYKFFDNFYMQPEVAFFDHGKDARKIQIAANGFPYVIGANDLGDDIFLGVHFQYDF